MIRGKDPVADPVPRLRPRTRRTVNLDNARRYSVSIPADWLKKADDVLPAGPNGRQPGRTNEGMSMDCQISRADDVAEVVLDRQPRLVLVALPLRTDRRGGPERGARGPDRHGGRLLPELERDRAADPLPSPVAQIGGRFRIVADSEAVGHVLKLTGVARSCSTRAVRRRREADPAARVSRRSSGDGHDPADLQEAERSRAVSASS